MGADQSDRRVRRTERAVRDAFQSLIEEKGYDAVTVQDILDRADVGRSTFYAHYRDKEDLLLKGFDDIRASLPSGADHGEHLSSGRSDLLGPTLAVFEHVEKYRHTWKPLVRKGGANVVSRALQDTAEQVIRDHLRQQFGGDDPRRLEPATQFLAGGLMGLLVWWLDSGSPAPSGEVHAMFTELAKPGVRRFLSA